MSAVKFKVLGVRLNFSFGYFGYEGFCEEFRYDFVCCVVPQIQTAITFPRTGSLPKNLHTTAFYQVNYEFVTKVNISEAICVVL